MFYIYLPFAVVEPPPSNFVAEREGKATVTLALHVLLHSWVALRAIMVPVLCFW